MAATAIRAAIRPYSMAVAPFSFLKSFRNFAISGLPQAQSNATSAPRFAPGSMQFAPEWIEKDLKRRVTNDLRSAPAHRVRREAPWCRCSTRAVAGSASREASEDRGVAAEV